MANPTNTSETSPLRDQESEEDCEYSTPTTATTTNCGCFPNLCFRWKKQSNNNCSETHLLNHQNQDLGTKGESWVVRKAKRVREISELWAGPKWKTFIRRFSVSFSNGGCGCGGGQSQRKKMQFQYDPQSYKLNFDDGVVRNDQDVVNRVDFSSRFAVPVLGMNRGS